MNIGGMDIAQIAELGTQVAQAGAIRALELVSDQVFDYVIGIAILVYELDPDAG